MRFVAIFYVIQSAVAIKYPPVTTWGFPEIEVEFLNDVSNPCLDDIFSSFHKAEPFLRTTIKEDNKWAIVPSPNGHSVWNIDELKDAAAVIVEDLSFRRKATRKSITDKRLSLEDVENAIEAIMPNNRPITSTGDWVKMNILEIMQSVLEDEAMGRDIKQDGYEIKILVLDLSLWKSDELHRALESTTINTELYPYLKSAHRDSDSKLENGEICVVTPVNIMPSKDHYYYLPPSTKYLLEKVRKLQEKMDD